MAEVSYQNISTTQNLPQWYSDYLNNVMGRAVGAAGETYQPYQGPRVAGFTPDQQAVFQGAHDIQGMLTPTINQAQSGTSAAGGINTGAAGADMYGRAADIYGNVAQSNTAGISSPFVNQGTGYLQQAASGSSLAAANPYIQQSVAPMGLGAAQPWLNAAGTSFPGSVDAYMSPYISGVTDRIAQLGARNLSENLLPQISDQFVRAGQYGSAQQRDVVGRALRDTQESVLGQQAQALEQGYGMAGQLYNQDASRYAGLAGTAGGLGTQQQQILQGAGTALGNLSATDLSRLAAAGVNIGNLGIGQAGVAGADYGRQLQAGQGLQGIGLSQIQAAQSDADRGLAAAQQLMNIGNQGELSRIRQLGILEGTGAQQQGLQQQNLNTAYGDFQEQRDYPWTQIGRLSNVIQGVPINMSGSSTSQTTNPSPSTTSQIAGLGLGIAGLSNSGLFKASGGAVKKPTKYKRAHSYGNVPRRGIAFMDEAA